MMHKLTSKIGWYSFKEGVLNLIRWLPIIWRDRDFDQNYLYLILQKKLEHMENFFRSEWAYTACANETADQIKEVKDIVNRLLSNSYFNDKIEDINTEEIFSIQNSLFVVNREHPDYPRWEASSMQADIDRENDKKRLFELICKNIDNWWD